MRVLYLSKALVVGQYQSKPELLAQKAGLELTVVVPPYWQDERGVLRLEKQNIDGYRLVSAPLRLNGHYHLHFYPTIGELVARLKPDIVHVDEEPYNLATFHAVYETRRQWPNAKILFFTWQNLLRSYPPPFSWMESYVYARTPFALAGSQTAVKVLRAKGFRNQVRVVPQFGVDPELFAPIPTARDSSNRLVIGFAARLVPEKGMAILLDAVTELKGDWELRVVGSGPERPHLEARARKLQVEDRITFLPWQPSPEMPNLLRQFDVLVAPSLSRPNWTEQFGRVLVEAMSCGVPVVASSAGEIPNVIGNAGIVFPEGDSTALAQSLRRLHKQELRAELGARGRARVLDKFTQQHVVDETYKVYLEMVS